MEVVQRILDRFKGLRGLQSDTFHEISKERGIGRAKVAQIQAVLEMGNRLSCERISEKMIINSTKDAANLILEEVGGLDHEVVWILLLDTRNRLIEIRHVYIGALNSAFARSGEIFKSAFLNNAAGIIV